MAFKIESELSEKQIEADIATYFGWITPAGNSAPFRLLDIDEQITGADKQFDTVIPIYMQFKVSEGLTQLPNFSLPHKFHPSPLQRIRKFRHKQGLYDNPTLYFKLRAKAKTADDFQHNILMKFANSGSSHSFYVAPLTLLKKEYEQMMFNSYHRYLNFPFHRFNLNVIHQERWTSYLGFVPFLRGHISIVPHERVDTDNHYYSYSPNGTDIAWHSPQKVSSSANRLCDMLRYIFSKAFINSKSWSSLNDYLSILAEDRDFDFYKHKNSDNKNVTPLEELISFGRLLYDKYEIRQLLLLSKREYLKNLKI